MPNGNISNVPPPIKDQIITFIIALARSLHAHGAPAHRVENVLEIISKRLGIEAQFFAMPTAIFASFEPVPFSRVLLSRLETGVLHLERLRQLDKIANDVFDGKSDVIEGARSIKQLELDKPRFGPMISTLAFGVVSGSAARFFGGGLSEIITALAIGLLIGVLALLAGRYQSLARIFEAVAAFVATVGAIAVSATVYPTAVHVAVLGGLIVLVPGLTLTISMRELASGHLACGTARFSGALMVFVFMGFGVALGTKSGQFVFGAQPATAVAAQLPIWTEWLSLVTASLCFGVLFRAAPRDFGWILLSGLLAYWGARLGSMMMGPELGAFTGALLVGVASNTFARITGAPASIPLVPGIMILVPGAIGFKSVSALVDHNILSGLETAFTALMVGISLVAGLLLASTLMPPKKAL